MDNDKLDFKLHWQDKPFNSRDGSTSGEFNVPVSFFKPEETVSGSNQKEVVERLIYGETISTSGISQPRSVNSPTISGSSSTKSMEEHTAKLLQADSTGNSSATQSVNLSTSKSVLLQTYHSNDARELLNSKLLDVSDLMMKEKNLHLFLAKILSNNNQINESDMGLIVFILNSMLSNNEMSALAHDFLSELMVKYGSRLTGQDMESQIRIPPSSSFTSTNSNRLHSSRDGTILDNRGAEWPQNVPAISSQAEQPKTQIVDHTEGYLNPEFQFSHFRKLNDITLLQNRAIQSWHPDAQNSAGLETLNRRIYDEIPGKVLATDGGISPQCPQVSVGPNSFGGTEVIQLNDMKISEKVDYHKEIHALLLSIHQHQSDGTPVDPRDVMLLTNAANELTSNAKLYRAYGEPQSRIFSPENSLPVERKWPFPGYNSSPVPEGSPQGIESSLNATLSRFHLADSEYSIETMHQMKLFSAAQQGLQSNLGQTTTRRAPVKAQQTFRNAVNQHHWTHVKIPSETLFKGKPTIGSVGGYFSSTNLDNSSAASHSIEGGRMFDAAGSKTARGEFLRAPLGGQMYQYPPTNATATYTDTIQMALQRNSTDFWQLLTLDDFAGNNLSVPSTNVAVPEGFEYDLRLQEIVHENSDRLLPGMPEDVQNPNSLMNKLQMETCRESQSMESQSSFENESTFVGCPRQDNNCASNINESANQLRTAVRGARRRKPEQPVEGDNYHWRKTGEKTLKDMQYYRSYYKCAYDVTCGARRKVDRRNDDFTVVDFSYSLEHDHPTGKKKRSKQNASKLE